MSWKALLKNAARAFPATWSVAQHGRHLSARRADGCSFLLSPVETTKRGFFAPDYGRARITIDLPISRGSEVSFSVKMYAGLIVEGDAARAIGALRGTLARYFPWDARLACSAHQLTLNFPFDEDDVERQLTALVEAMLEVVEWSLLPSDPLECLVSAIQHSSTGLVRSHATQLLLAEPRSEAVMSAIEQAALASEDFDCRIELIRALGVNGERFIETLAVSASARDLSASVFDELVHMLSAEQAQRLLERVGNDARSPRLRLAALRRLGDEDGAALEQLADHDATAASLIEKVLALFPSFPLSAVLALFRGADSKSLPGLVALAAADVQLGLVAIKAIAERSSEEHERALIEIVERGASQDVKIEAVRALGGIGSIAAREGLLKDTASRAPEVMRWTIVALDRIAERLQRKREADRGRLTLAAPEDKSGALSAAGGEGAISLQDDDPAIGVPERCDE